MSKRSGECRVCTKTLWSFAQSLGCLLLVWQMPQPTPTPKGLPAQAVILRSGWGGLRRKGCG